MKICSLDPEYYSICQLKELLNSNHCLQYKERQNSSRFQNTLAYNFALPSLQNRKTLQFFHSSLYVLPFSIQYRSRCVEKFYYQHSEL